MSYIEDNSAMEISTVISKAESLLTNKFFHESHSEHRSFDGDHRDSLHNDGCTSRFKMSIDSTNPLRKEHLDDSSIEQL